MKVRWNHTAAWNVAKTMVTEARRENLYEALIKGYDL
jgi:hypothetical protein